MDNKPEWERVAPGLLRVPCPGGWIYCSETGQPDGSDPICFVPSPPDGADAPHRVCNHGFAAHSCPQCFPRNP